MKYYDSGDKKLQDRGPGRERGASTEPKRSCSGPAACGGSRERRDAGLRRGRLRPAGSDEPKGFATRGYRLLRSCRAEKIGFGLRPAEDPAIEEMRASAGGGCGPPAPTSRKDLRQEGIAYSGLAELKKSDSGCGLRKTRRSKRCGPPPGEAAARRLRRAKKICDKRVSFTRFFSARQEPRAA